MDIALHPQFAQNKKVYLSYSKSMGRKQTTAVAVAILKEDKLTHLKDIFTAKPAVSADRHFGSRLLFDKKGFLYVTIGDRTKRHQAQKKDGHLGKILRFK